MLSQSVPPIQDRIESYLSWLAELTSYNPSVIDATVGVGKVAQIASCSADENDCIAFVSGLEEMGYLKCIQGGQAHFPENWKIRLTFNGLAFISDAQSKADMSNEIFLAMWFDQSMDTFAKHLTDGFAGHGGFELIRIDKAQHNNKIDDEIVARIRKSRLIIADFTCPDNGQGHRGGVYYEAGFAHGLGKNVIFTVRDDCVEKLHFDTRQYNHIIWKTIPSGEVVVVDSENKTLFQAVMDRIRALGIEGRK